MFGRERIRQLEGELAEAQSQLELTTSRLSEAESALSTTKQTVVDQAEALVRIGASLLISPSSALLTLAEIAPEAVQASILPQIVLRVNIQNISRRTLGDEIASFSNSLSTSLIDYLVNPRIESYELGDEYISGLGETRPVVYFGIIAQLKCEIGTCSAAMTQFIKQAFGPALKSVEMSLYRNDKGHDMTFTAKT